MQRVKSSPEEIVQLVEAQVEGDEYQTDDDTLTPIVPIDDSAGNHYPEKNVSTTSSIDNSTAEDLLVIHVVSFVDPEKRNNPNSRKYFQNDTNNNSYKNNNKNSHSNTDVLPSLALYHEMTPPTRIVALPYYTLGHSSASTLVSISLVVFGAMPLAYRSLKYMYDYPAYANVIALSVLLSISYGIYSQRVSAWTNQSYVVSNAMWHRLQGRDDAVVVALKESAIERVCEAVLDEYYRYQLPVFFPTQKCPWRAQVPGLKNPLMIAIELGLIRPKDQADSDTVAATDQGPTRWKSVPIEDVIQNLL
jgi:hypothetical protein